MTHFINTLHSVIPYARWQLKLLITPQSNPSDIRSWRVKGITKPVLEHVKTGKNIQAYLTLRHTDEETILLKPNRKRNLSQYSSTLLRHVFHILAIMIGIEPKEEHGSTVPNVPVRTETAAGEAAQAQHVEVIQKSPLSDNGTAPDDIAQPSSLSELGAGIHSQQEQSQQTELYDALEKYLGMKV